MVSNVLSWRAGIHKISFLLLTITVQVPYTTPNGGEPKSCFGRVFDTISFGPTSIGRMSFRWHVMVMSVGINDISMSLHVITCHYMSLHVITCHYTSNVITCLYTSNVITCHYTTNVITCHYTCNGITCHYTGNDSTSNWGNVSKDSWRDVSKRALSPTRWCYQSAV
jgi:hypothetical protein